VARIISQLRAVQYSRHWSSMRIRVSIVRPLSILVLALVLAVCSSAEAATRTPLPAVCTSTDQCTSGFCTNGVCCDTASCPSPERCDIFGSVGVCSPPLDTGQECRLNTDCDQSLGLLCLFCTTGLPDCPTAGVYFCAVPPPTPTPTPLPYTPTLTICGLVLGYCCDNGTCYVPDSICVDGTCQLVPTPTPTPVPGECGSVCDGRPCTGFLIRGGTCQPNGNQCACIPNTPAPGECALACDGRACVGKCSDGSTASGFCTALTVDQGCACALECSTPTPTPTPTEPCSGVPCSGTCGFCPPCTPGTICPLTLCEFGHCEVVSGSCACVPGILTPTPTPAPPTGTCIGDCDGSGQVTVNELILGVNIALGSVDFSACPAFDCNSDCHPGPIPATPIPSVDVACLIRAVNNALDGCPPPICTSDTDCDDANGCTADQCTIDGCTHTCVCD
jgi:hypothetical protein